MIRTAITQCLTFVFNIACPQSNTPLMKFTGQKNVILYPNNWDLDTSKTMEHFLPSRQAKE